MEHVHTFEEAHCPLWFIQKGHLVFGVKLVKCDLQYFTHVVQQRALEGFVTRYNVL